MCRLTGDSQLRSGDNRAYLVTADYYIYIGVLGFDIASIHLV